MQMKTLFRVAVATPLAGALLLSQPAQAASYKIEVGANLLTSATRATFVLTDCDPNGPAKELNGTDGRFVDATGLGGKLVRLTWSGALFGGQLLPSFYTSGCDLITNTGNPTEVASAANLRIPANARWIFMDAYQNAKITFNLNVIPG